MGRRLCQRRHRWVLHLAVGLPQNGAESAGMLVKHACTARPWGVCPTGQLDWVLSSASCPDFATGDVEEWAEQFASDHWATEFAQV